jgi:hypothetical protein
MSSWYVWAAMGMYPQMPGRAELVLASPLFPQIVVTRATGQQLRIKAPEASASNYYVQSLKVNGAASTRPWLPESVATGGGTVAFTLGSTPNTAWGSDPADQPPSFREGEVPLRPFTDPSRVVVGPGSTGTAKLGALSITDTTTVNWRAEPPAGITVTPASGSFEVPGGATATTEVQVGVAIGVAQGYYSVPVAFSTADGVTLPRGGLLVVAAEPGSMFAAYNNAGISADADQAAADVDGYGYSYSVEALAAAGVRRGGTVTVGDFAFAWPDTPPGRFDNVVPTGQQLSLADAPADASRLSFLGSATGGKATGAVTIRYTDGSTQNAQLAYSDWTLGGGGSPVEFGNVIAARSAYRNSAGGTSQQVGTYLFATAPIALQAGKRVASVTLPSTSTGGTIHVFAVDTA